VERFRAFSSYYRLLIATAASALSVLLFEYLERTFSSSAIALGVLLVIVSVAATILNSAVEGLIERSVRVRRWIAGNDHIEGYWYDLSVDRTTGQVIHAVLISISVENGELRLTGIGVAPDGRRLSTFRSTNASYANGVLHCQYESHTEYFESAIEAGIMQLQFDRPPMSYTGFYVDYTNTIRSLIHGCRVSDREMREMDHFRDVGSKERFLLGRMGNAWVGNRAGLHSKHLEGSGGSAAPLPPQGD